MQKNKSRCLLILHLLLFTLQLQSEGFLAGTLVKTPSGYFSIEQLSKGDTLVSYSYQNHLIETPIALTTTFRYDCCIKITTADLEIYCAPDQTFYSYNQQQWITADQLTVIDFLVDDNGNSIPIDTIETIQKQYNFYALSLKTNHTFCISQYNIVVHNIIMTVPLISIITPAIAPVLKTCLIAGASLISAHFAKKFAHKNNRSCITHTTARSNFPQKDPNNNDDDDKDDKDKDKYDTNKYPNGIYKDAGYHHNNSNRIKSKCPKNGQQLLNNAIKVEQSEDALIAVENDYFVIFYKTMEKEFHGHVREWKQLTDHMKNTLINHGLVKRSGKIIRQTIK